MESGFRFIAEEVFSLPGRGVVVTGRIEEGSIVVGDEVGFLATDGKWTNALVIGIEVSRLLVNEAGAGQRASILLEGVRKDHLTRGTVLLESPTAAAPGPIYPSSPEPPPSPSAYSDSPPPSARAIHPSSSMWRTILFVGMGILLIVALFYLKFR